MSDRALAAILFAVAAGAALYQYPRLMVLIVAVVLLLRAWLWLCRRHPLVAICIHGFLSGLLGGRRRR
jgi:hypothetical protein